MSRGEGRFRISDPLQSMEESADLASYVCRTVGFNPVRVCAINSNETP